MISLDSALSNPVIPILVRWHVSGKTLSVNNMRPPNSVREDRLAHMESACKSLGDKIEPLMIPLCKKFVTKSVVQSLVAQIAEQAVKVSREFDVVFVVDMEIVQ